jgi:hypothetical protein
MQPMFRVGIMTSTLKASGGQPVSFRTPPVQSTTGQNVLAGAVRFVGSSRELVPWIISTTHDDYT